MSVQGHFTVAPWLPVLQFEFSSFSCFRSFFFPFFSFFFFSLSLSSVRTSYGSARKSSDTDQIACDSLLHILDFKRFLLLLVLLLLKLLPLLLLLSLILPLRFLFGEHRLCRCQEIGPTRVSQSAISSFHVLHFIKKIVVAVVQTFLWSCTSHGNKM